MGEMEHLAGLLIIENNDGNGICIHQPALLTNLKLNLKVNLKDTARIYMIPTAPMTLIACPKEGTKWLHPIEGNN
jgi:hypothetical protein